MQMLNLTMIRTPLIAAVALCALHANAQAQSVMLASKPDTALANATVSTQQELHPLKARFERQRTRDLRRSMGSVDPIAIIDGDRATLPTIEIVAGETTAAQLSENARVKKGVDDAFGPERVRVALYNDQQVINGTPLPGVAWAAWTNPGSIQFWLR
jgi:hypothetical protein